MVTSLATRTLGSFPADDTTQTCAPTGIIAGLRASRLRLAQLTLRELELTLSLLGIEVPERM